MLLTHCGTFLLQVTRLSASVSLFHETRFLYHQQSCSLWDAGGGRPVPQVTQLILGCQNFPGFGTESPTLWESPRSRGNLDGQVPCPYPRGFLTLSCASHAQQLLPYGTRCPTPSLAAKASPAWPLTPLPPLIFWPCSLPAHSCLWATADARTDPHLGFQLSAF